MNKLSVTAILTFLLLACSPAYGQSAKSFFTQAQTFKSCSETTVFACGKISPTGERYGTAHTRTMCSQYEFGADGTVNLMDYMGLPQPGRYHVKGNTVFIDRLDEKGKVTSTFTLELSKDGKTLGKMKRVEPDTKK